MMRLSRWFGVLSVLALVLGGAATANASAILYYNDLTLGTDQMAAALADLSGTHTVTTATSPTDFATQIATGNYDLGIFFEQNSTGSDYDAAFTALAAFIAGGGAGIVDDWSVSFGSHDSLFGLSESGADNQTSMTVTDPTLAAGLTNPVLLFDSGWGIFSYGLSGGTGVASFPDASSAIVSASGGQLLFNGFLSDTFADGTQGKQLYINEIGYVLGNTVPEPATVSLLGLGALALMRRRAKNASR